MKEKDFVRVTARMAVAASRFRRRRKRG